MILSVPFAERQIMGTEIELSFNVNKKWNVGTRTHSLLLVLFRKFIVDIVVV